MTEREQQAALETDVRKLIERYRREFEVTYASVIGVLQLAILDLYREAQDDE